jgi:hypothetical protein
MNLLPIDQQLLDTLTEELVPRVEEITGWRVAREGLTVRPIPKDQAYEETVLDQLNTLGLIRPEDRAGLLKRIVEYFVESNILGVYQYWDGEILIVRENVDESNLDGLKLVLGHELAHRAQHTTHPELYKRLDGLQREFLATDDPQIMAELQQIMTLLESHAYYVQERLRQRYYPDASIESHCSLVAILGWIKGKLVGSKYTDQLPEIAEAARAGQLDTLFGK